VYRKEFVFDSRHGTQHEAEMAFLGKYQGRVRPEDGDVRVDPIRESPFELWIRRWNLVGEYKHPEDADSKANELRVRGLEVMVVLRNSRGEHRLRSYGVVKLPT
jgi:hypothetical protein